MKPDPYSSMPKTSQSPSFRPSGPMISPIRVQIADNGANQPDTIEIRPVASDRRIIVIAMGGILVLFVFLTVLNFLGIRLG